MTKKWKWGILAPGKMSAKFTRGLQLLDNAELFAVGSRDITRARQFAAEFGFNKSFGSYEELATDPDVEIIYVASPHSHHFEHTMLCLGNGKHVLCEKAFAMNGAQVRAMTDAAKSRGLFLMEALWPPFQPYYARAKELIGSGVLGNIIHMHAWFSFIPPYDPLDRKFNLSLGGGSLLDIGIYPVIDALTFMGFPAGIVANAAFCPTGAEESVTGILKYPGERMATFYSSFKTSAGIGCELFCEKGNLVVARGRDMNQRTILKLHGEKEVETVFSPPAMGYHFEADEVMKCLDNGLTESKIVPHSFSIGLMDTLDRIRESAGIRYPGE